MQKVTTSKCETLVEYSGIEINARHGKLFHEYLAVMLYNIMELVNERSNDLYLSADYFTDGIQNRASKKKAILQHLPKFLESIAEKKKDGAGITLL